jgi:hypothetical protein
MTPDEAGKWYASVREQLAKVREVIENTAPKEIASKLGSAKIQESIILERKFRKIFYEHFGDFS